MLPSDPRLDREVRAENRGPGRWRRHVFIAVTVLMVALFAWVALTIVATPAASPQSPQPSPGPPFYPEGTGVTFEPVGPSMWRVVEPEPDCERLPPMRSDSLEIAPDGRAWYLDKRGIWELGACPILGPDFADFTGPRAHAIAPDGTVWVLERDRLMSWEDGDWVLHAEGEFNVSECDALGDGPDTWEGVREYGGECSGCEGPDCRVYFTMDMAPDGTVWFSGWPVSAYDGEKWTHYPELHYVLGFGPDGDVWVEDTNGELYVIRP